MGVVETAIIVGAIGATAAAGTSIYQAGEAKSAARRNASIQKEQAQLQARIAEVNRRRQARIATAMKQAEAGASGLGGSIITDPQVSLNTYLESQSEYASQGLDLTTQAISSAESQAVGNANVSIAQSVGSLVQTGAGIYGQYAQFSDIKNQQIDEELNQFFNF